ncbi:DUF2723 domain-containing protein [Leptospira sp. 96542]|nr:DUF2723 domain-containing protein [Leptospira sp. 96542]
MFIRKKNKLLNNSNLANFAFSKSIFFSLFSFITINSVIILLHYSAMVKDVGTYDTAKFQYTGYTLGVPHTSGYPLYTLLSWVFTHLLPFGEIAWRQNVLNLLFSIITLNFLFLIFRHLKVGTFISILLVFVQSFSLTFWYISFQAEVYSLHIMFISIIIFLLIKAIKTNEDNYIFGTLVVYGLMFSHHLTSICLFPGLLVFILYRNWRILLEYKIYLFSVIGISLGLLPYLYIWIRFHAPNNVFVEMHVYDLNSFFNEITGGEFQNDLFNINWNKLIIAQLPMTYKFFKSGELGYLIFFGLFAFFNKKLRSLLFFIFLTIIINIYFAISFDVSDPWGYYTPIYFLLIILVGVGIQEFLNYIHERKSKYFLFSLIVISILLFGRGYKVYKNNSKRIATFTQKEEIYRELSYKYLATLKSNCVFIITSDQAWQTMNYLMQIKKMNQGVILVPLLSPKATTKHIEDYMNGKSFYDRYFRYNVEPGLQVYINDSDWIRRFQNLGYAVKEGQNGLSILYLPKKR